MTNDGEHRLPARQTRPQGTPGAGLPGDSTGAPHALPPGNNGTPRSNQAKTPRRIRIDRERLCLILSEHARVLILSGLLVGIAAGWAAWSRTPFVAMVMIDHRPPPASLLAAIGDPSLPAAQSVDSAAAFLQSSPAWPGQAPGGAQLEAESRILNGQLVIHATSPTPEEASRQANQAASNAVQALNTRWTRIIADRQRAVQERLDQVDRDFQAINAELIEFQRSTGAVDLDQDTPAHLKMWVDLERHREELVRKIETADRQLDSLSAEMSKQSPELLDAREALRKARLTLTEEHPTVQKLRAALASAEERAGQAGAAPQVARGDGAVSSSLYLQMIELKKTRIAAVEEIATIDRQKLGQEAMLKALPERQTAYARLRSRYAPLRQSRDLLASEAERLRLVSGQTTLPFLPGAPATPDQLSTRPRWNGGILGGLGGFALGGVLALAALAGLERARGRIRTAADLARATELPLLGVLPDIRDMRKEEKERWAFQTLARLRHFASAPDEKTLVCGFTSAQPGEGRSTWIKLLAEAGSRQGYRVLTICTWKSRFRTLLPTRTSAGRAQAQTQAPPQAEDASPQAGSNLSAFESAHAIITASDKPVVHLPLSGWVWNLEQRRQWQQAFEKWKQIDNLIVLVELPPATARETFLLAESLPQTVWLCSNDMVTTEETVTAVETLRFSGTRLIGSVLNRARPVPGLLARAARTTAATALLLASLVFTGAAVPAAAQENSVKPVPASITNASFSVVSPSQIAPWQQRLTLGPGDTLDLSLYGQPETLKLSVLIGPDGKLNFLQALDFPADGLTVDELRAKLEAVLGKFYLSPRVVAVPKSFQSKKYYVMGNVVQRGVFPLTRPVTVLEAIAAARGFPAPEQAHASMISADLSRSFLIRQSTNGLSERVPVDFEGLFRRGELQHNISVAPGDYLYFPPLDLQEVYVLGQVTRPGAVNFNERMGVVQAVVSSGGFVEKAYRTRVLVIRGSLTAPQTFTVDISAALKARGTDFVLQPRDIIFVARRPWSKAEELLEAAVNDFLKAAVFSWTGQHVGPFIKDPIF